MALKKVANYVRYDWQGFAKDKRFICTGCSEWKDHDTGKHFGSLVEATIIEDKTVYYDKDGNEVKVTNRFLVKEAWDEDIYETQEIKELHEICACGYDCTKNYRNGNYPKDEGIACLKSVKNNQKILKLFATLPGRFYT